MPKKSNTKRTDGRIAVQIYLGKDEQGRRKYKTVYGTTQKEANRKADELRSQLAKGMDISHSRDSFKKWAELFLNSQKTRLTASEYDLKAKRIKYFFDYFGETEINSVKVYHIEEAINDLAAKNPSTGKPSAAKTIRGYKQVCSQVFAFAVKNRVIEFNPASVTEIPKGAPKAERRALSEAERQWIIDLTPKHRAKRAAMIAMFCGLRRGELTALTWSDVDFVKSTITVNKSYDFKSNVLKLPKTAAGIRTIPMPQILSDYLRSESHTDAYICCAASGGMMSVDGWKRLMESLLTELEIAHGSSKKTNKFAPSPTVLTIQPFGWHDLRHTYATILFEAGVDVLTAQYLLGHSSPETTMMIYTHLSNAQKSRSIDKLNSFVKQSCKSNASQAI